MALPADRFLEGAKTSGSAAGSGMPVTIHYEVRSTSTDSPVVATEPIHILLIDDVDAEALLFERMLTRDFPGAYRVSSALTLRDGLALLRSESFDCILLDHRLPDGLGVDSIDQVQAIGGAIPIIVLTGMRDPDLEFAALAAGAQDYLAKDDLSSEMVRKAILYAIERTRLLHELMDAKTDQLTLQREFFSHVSHELRTPVAAMYLSATNLGDGLLGRVSSEQREAVELIADNARQLRRLVDDLLDATRLAEGEVPVDTGRVDIVEIATGAARRHESRGGFVETPVHLEVLGDVPSVIADVPRVVQILDNLLSNALKYAPGKLVTITVETDPDAPDHVRVSVADGGPGIPEEDRERVFERMVQLEHETYHVRRGLGLGLFISRDLARRMGGDLWVEPADGGGATFGLRLPAHPLDSMLTRLISDRPKELVEVAVVDVDVLDGHGVLEGTGFEEEILRDVREAIESSFAPVAVVPMPASTVLRCAAPRTGSVGFETQLRSLVSESTAVKNAGLTPTFSTRPVAGSKGRRKSIRARVDETVRAILN